MSLKLDQYNVQVTMEQKEYEALEKFSRPNEISVKVAV